MSVLMNLRMPEALKERLAEKAAQTKRTQTSLVIEAIEASFGPPQAPAQLPPVVSNHTQKPIQHQDRPFKCPDNRCKNRFGSEAAQCPIHGRKAVPA